MSKISEQEQKVAVVTGCSSGIGFETSIALAKSRFYTYATLMYCNSNYTFTSLDIFKVHSL
jgi:hypothetical protein